LLLLPRTSRLRERSRSRRVPRLDVAARVEHAIVGVFGRALDLDGPVCAGSRSRELLLELADVCVCLRVLRGGDALFERFDGRLFDLVLQLSFAEIELDLLLLLQRLPVQRVPLSAVGRRWVGWCCVCSGPIGAGNWAHLLSLL